MEFGVEENIMSEYLQELEFIENKFLERLKTIDYNSSNGLDQTRDLIYDCLLDIGMDQLATAIDNVLSMAVESKIDYVKENRCSFFDVLRFQ